MATFARKKYPHLIHGVFASSGLFRAEVHEESYYDNLSYNLIQHGGIECHHRVQNTFNILEYLIKNSEAAYLQQRLRLSNLPETDNDQEVGILVEKLIDYISAYIKRFNVYGLQSFCRDMNYFPDDTLNSLIRWVLCIDPNGPECYSNNYEAYIELLNDVNWNATYAQRRAVSYLRCTQIGAFRIPSDYQMTAFPQLLTEEYQYKFCEDVFGEQYNRSMLQNAVENLNLMYGGQEQRMSHVIYTNGLDPWIRHGGSEYGEVESTVVFLYYAAAGADLSSISAEESIELTRAKEEITQYLTRWARESN